nr:methyl-accepting chemotaxis protein [uncultured Undibacterium sp.]
MNFNNLKIGQKLGLSFAIVIALMLLVSITAYSGLKTLAKDLDVISNDRYPKVVQVQQVKSELNEIARNMRNILILKDPEILKAEYANIEESAKIIAQTFDKLDQSIVSEKGRALVKSVTEVREAFIVSRNKFLNLTRQGQNDEAIALLQTETRTVQLKYFAALDGLIEFQEKLMTDSAQTSEEFAKNKSMLVIALTLLALVLACILGWYVTRTITRPLGKAVYLARRVADGDLTTQVEVESNDETGQLMLALKEMSDGLVKIVAQVRSGTDTIATASSQIAAGNMDLSSRTEEQASSLEETASSMEELTSTVKQNADNARQANKLASSASDVAVLGGSMVAKVVDTMGSINTSSKKIVDIISVIDGIAFQTNILALNAAVEAARAGEQGRGFAVVASEVRTLAQRSAAAAKEIKSLIDDSVSKVSEGSKLVNDAGKTMDEIVISVKRVSDVISEITAASSEQTSGIEQINIAIVQMDEVTQQNASLVEQAAAAAEAMLDQARNLSDVVSVFKLDMVQSASVNAVAVLDKSPSKSNRNYSVKPTMKKLGINAGSARKAGTSSSTSKDDDWTEF